MNFILALAIAGIAVALIFVLFAVAQMAHHSEKSSEAKVLRQALGTYDNFQRGQLSLPHLVSSHKQSCGMAWDEQNKKYVAQSALSKAAYRSALISG